MWSLGGDILRPALEECLPALGGALSLPLPLPLALALTLRCPLVKPSGVEPFGNCNCHAG